MTYLHIFGICLLWEFIIHHLGRCSRYSEPIKFDYLSFEMSFLLNLLWISVLIRVCKTKKCNICLENMSCRAWFSILFNFCYYQDKFCALLPSSTYLSKLIASICFHWSLSELIVFLFITFRDWDSHSPGVRGHINA